VSLARDQDRGSISAAVEVALVAIQDAHALTPQSERRLGHVIRQFQSFVESGLGLPDLDSVKPEHVSQFLRARQPEGDAPSTATLHLRRSALRLLYGTARRLELANGDPTLDLALPPRSSLPRRPLTDDEIAVCRSFASHTLSETRRPAAWALAEATARTSEIPHIRPADVDLTLGRVWIHGGSKTSPRWGRLTEWGVGRLQERLKWLKSEIPVVYQGRGSAESRQASSCSAIAQTLQRVGLAGESDLGPSSVPAWAGVRALRGGAAIDEVARMLGIRSLDRAARFVGWDWTKER
jgi:integrase family protein with SAM-like domain